MIETLLGEVSMYLELNILFHYNCVESSEQHYVLNTSAGLGEQEMLWEHEPQAIVSTAFLSSPKPSRVFL